MAYMNQKKSSILAAVTALALVVSGYFIWRYMAAEPQGISFTLQDATAVDVTGFSPDSADAETYTHDGYRMSFKYPRGFKVISIPDDIGESIVVQDAEAKIGFQIYVSPFDESGSVITEERLRADIPDIVIEDAQPIALEEGSAGIAFITGEGQYRTREVWFAYDGYLYQINAPLAYDALLQKVLSAWQFLK